MEIKHASSYDFVEVLFLLRECITDMNARGLKHWNNSFPGSDVMKDDIEKGTLFLCKDRGIIKGMINLSNEAPEEYDNIKWSTNSEKVLYIKRFAVHPKWTNTGVGLMLLEYAEKHATEHGYTSIRIDVLDSYLEAEKLIENKSFQQAGTFHSSFQKIPFACYEKEV